jgi:SAM-dependent methyltransferase
MLVSKFLSKAPRPRFKPSLPSKLRRTRCSSPETPLPDVFLEYDPSPLHLIHTMLDEAKLQPHETFLDFGSGDGRWVIEAAKCYGSKSVGIEIAPQWVEFSKKEIEKEQLGHLAEIWKVDGFKTDLSFADVVSVYNTKEGMSVLIPKLQRELKPGARLICIKLPVDGWIPDFQKRMYEFKVYIYNMPPKINQKSSL